MTSASSHSKHQRPRDAVALVRLVLSWLLVAVLAVDLVTSPLHRHVHNGEWSAGGTLEASPAHANDPPVPGSADVFLHIDHGESPEFSHSISALRSPVEVKATVLSLDDAPAAAPWYVLAPGLPAEAAVLVWPPDRHRAGSGAFRSLPPNGRAPPLHA